ncbi:MAG: hypothetical protein HYU58_14565 [Proteobacteria bacterium]|nr:hypothetical protein [Pseudomonadota bacterium]
MAEMAGALLQRGLGAVHRQISRNLPSHTVFNYCLALPRFCHGNGRMPRASSDPRATLNDIIFHRMIRNEWSVLQQTCVDKEYAKELAVAKAPLVKAAMTESVLHLTSATDVTEVADWLKPFLGHKLVVKPTHSFGSILYLDDTISMQRLADFLRYAKRNFFHARREAQYRNLEKKLIVEQNLAPDQRIKDYKFACSDGYVMHGRLDVDRFTPQHRRALFTVPEFDVIPVRCGGLDFPERIERPPHLAEMVEIAAQLSRGFDFVRIDLYDTPQGVYFGEFTFTPSAGACAYSDEEIAIAMALRLKMIAPNMIKQPKRRSAQQIPQHGIEALAPEDGGKEAPLLHLKKSAFAEAS